MSGAEVSATYEVHTAVMQLGGVRVCVCGYVCPRKAVAMQSRAPSPNTHSGVSAKSKAVIYVLSKLFFFLRACFIRAQVNETPGPRR